MRVRRTVRRIYHRLSPGVLVLLYHRVTTLASDPQLLAVSPNRFDEHLAVLKSRWPVLSTNEVVEAVRRGKMPRRAVAITFDDGYADNLFEAHSILEKHELPATYFVATGLLGTADEFFWDELERLLLAPGPAAEPFAFRGQTWAMPEMDVVHEGWNVLMSTTPTPRHQAYRDLCALAAWMSSNARAELLEHVRLHLKAPALGRASHRVMTESEVMTLSRSPGATIGAHTVTHPRLANLNVVDQKAEIAGSKERLEQVIGRPVESFSYPFGNHADYTARTVEAVRESGIGAAFSNFGGSVRKGSDLMTLRRVLVRDWPAGELAERIESWFDE